MPDKSPEEKDGLLEIIQKFWLPVAGFLGAITLAYNFYQLWLGDQKTVTWFLAGGGLVVLTIVLGWVGYSKKIVVYKKKSKREPRYSLNYRRIALGSLGLILIGNGIGGWLLYKNLQLQVVVAEKKVIVLVAKFDGPEDEYGLRDEMIEQLREATKGYEDTEIIAAEEMVTVAQGSKYAREVGQKYQADLVIWAWYRPTDNPNITIHFENLVVTNFEFINNSETYKPQATLADLESFEVQRKLGTEASTLIAFLAGMLRYEAEDYQTTLDRLEPILLQESTSTYIEPVTLYFYTARSYEKLKKYQLAIERYSKAIELDNTNVAAYNNRGNVYGILSDDNLAIQDFNRAIELDSNYTWGYINRGLSYSNQGDYVAAIEDYNKAIQLDPNEALTYFNRGIAYGNLEQYEKSIEDFNQAIKITPSHISPNKGVVYYSRAVSKQSLAGCAEALQDYNEAIQLGYFIAYNNRGLCYYTFSQYEKAIQDFNQAISNDPNFVEAYNNRGLSYHELKTYDQAIENFNKAITLKPNDPEIYYNRGLSYSFSSQLEKGIEDFTKTIQLDPNNSSAYLGLGNNYYNIGKQQESIAYFSLAIELDPSLANAYKNRGYAYAWLEMHAESESDFAKYKELTGQDVP